MIEGISLAIILTVFLLLFWIITLFGVGISSSLPLLSAAIAVAIQWKIISLLLQLLPCATQDRCEPINPGPNLEPSGKGPKEDRFLWKFFQEKMFSNSLLICGTKTTSIYIQSIFNELNMIKKDTASFSELLDCTMILQNVMHGKRQLIK